MAETVTAIGIFSFDYVYHLLGLSRILKGKNIYKFNFFLSVIINSFLCSCIYASPFLSLSPSLPFSLSLYVFVYCLEHDMIELT